MPSSDVEVVAVGGMAIDVAKIRMKDTNCLILALGIVSSEVAGRQPRLLTQ